MMFEKFRSDTHGATAIIAAFLGLLMVSFVAFMVDLAVITKAKKQVQSALDIAILASLDPSGGDIGRRRAFNSSFDLNTNEMKFINGSVRRTISFSRDMGAAQANAAASATLDLPFGAIVGRNVTIELETSAEHVTPNLELALALDISSSMDGAKITELQDASLIVIDEVLDGSTDSVLSIVPYGGSVRLPGSMISQLRDTPADPSLTWVTGAWNQCFVYRPDDLRDGFGPGRTHTFMPDFWIFGGRDSACPEAGNEAVFATRDNVRARNLVQNFSLSDGTSTDVGVNWALNALTHRWEGRLPGAEPGFPARRGTTKVMVVMSDGAIVNHHLPSDSEINARAGHPGLGNLTSSVYRTSRQIIGFNANSHLQATCARARREGVIVFAIAFAVETARARQSLENCAGDPSRYFDADPGQLLLVFRTILDTVEALRLTG